MSSAHPETDYERGYSDGKRAALRQVLTHVLRGLGYESAEAAETLRVAWVTEREDALATLRRICADHGDLDWSSDDHLADILDKHLRDHLEADT